VHTGPLTLSPQCPSSLSPGEREEGGVVVKGSFGGSEDDAISTMEHGPLFRGFQIVKPAALLEDTHNAP